jgi:tetratricopeptide (TPR) repeat protein
MKNSNTISQVKSSQVSDQKAIDTSKGNSFEELYLKNNYKGAANYLLQNKQQLSSGIFHYNLGTVYSKMGDYAAARFHLEKAIKDGYINSSSLNNLKFIKSQLQVDDISNSTGFPDEVMNIALSIPSAAYFSFTFLIKNKKASKENEYCFLYIYHGITFFIFRRVFG